MLKLIETSEHFRGVLEMQMYECSAKVQVIVTFAKGLHRDSTCFQMSQGI